MNIGRVVVARIGWMKYYADSQPGDERPIGGGEYNKEHKGSEIVNFRNVGGFLYGYARTGNKKRGLNLRCIDPRASGDSLQDCTIIFVAKRPKIGGQVIVGWYHDCELYAELHETSDQRLYLAKAETADAVLVPLEDRTLEVQRGKRGKRGMGQANVFYRFDRYGRPRKWEKLIAYVQRYQGRNWLNETSRDEDGTIAEIHQALSARRSGQGRIPDSETRRKIEDHAMNAANRYYKRKGYKVRIQGKRYDLECIKGKRKLFVEVKGTTLSGETVWLTAGEVNWAREHPGQMELFVLRLITVEQESSTPVVKGGQQVIVSPWRVEDSRLRPLYYEYRTDGGKESRERRE